MSEVAMHAAKKELEPHLKALVLELNCDDLDGDDVEVPYVRYVLPATLKLGSTSGWQ